LYISKKKKKKIVFVNVVSICRGTSHTYHGQVLNRIHAIYEAVRRNGEKKNRGGSGGSKKWRKGQSQNLYIYIIYDIINNFIKGLKSQLSTFVCTYISFFRYIIDFYLILNKLYYVYCIFVYF
jgi:hypothetical protein